MPFYTRHKVEPLQVLGQYLSPLLFERALLFGPHAPVLHHANLQAAITRGNHVRGLEELLLLDRDLALPVNEGGAEICLQLDAHY